MEDGSSTIVAHKIAEAKNHDCLSAFFDEVLMKKVMLRQL